MNHKHLIELTNVIMATKFRSDKWYTLCSGLSRFRCRRLLQWLRFRIWFLLYLHVSSMVVLAQESEAILDTMAARPVIVNLPDLGRIQGKREGGTDFFGGVPYAAPPVGQLRKFVFNLNMTCIAANPKFLLNLSLV
jgi:hypothetical protein